MLYNVQYRYFSNQLLFFHWGQGLKRLQLRAPSISNTEVFFIDVPLTFDTGRFFQFVNPHKNLLAFDQ